MAFKDRLKQARKNKGFTQVQLASLIGVTKGAVGNYESGVSSAKSEVLFKLFSILEVSPNFLFQDDVTGVAFMIDSPQEQTHIETYRLLDQEGQDKLAHYAVDLVRSGRYNNIDNYAIGSHEHSKKAKQ